MKQQRHSMQNDHCDTDQGLGVLNIFDRIASEPLEKLKQKRTKIAAQLSALLATLNLSHAKVAKKANIKPSQLSRQLAGDANLTIDTISRICVAADADFDIVFRKKAAAAAKQFWEKDDACVTIVEASSQLKEELLASTVLAASENWWKELSAIHISTTSYRMEVDEIFAQGGCLTVLAADAANETQDYEPTQPIAA